MTDELAMPSRLGPFQIGDMLGSNGVLFTVAARHGGQNFDAVITFAEIKGIEASAREQFQAEAAALAGKSFKHVVPPVQWGEEEGRLWCASPRLAGDHTGNHMRTSGLPPAGLSVELARQVVLGLAELTEHGLCHGAISPATVFVDSTASSLLLHAPWVKIIQGLEGRYLHPSLMSVLAFTAPEVAVGGAPTTQGDAYSLGSMLYFLLMGAPTHWADDPASLLAAIQQGPADFGAIRANIHADVADLLEDLLAADPDDRPVNWPALEQRLAAIVASIGAVMPADLPPLPADGGPPPGAVVPPQIALGTPTPLASAPPPPVAPPQPLPPAAPMFPTPEQQAAMQAAAPPPPPQPSAKPGRPAPAAVPVFDPTAGMGRDLGSARKPGATASAPSEPIESTGASPKVAIVIIVVFIALIGLSVGGFFFWQSRAKQAASSDKGPDAGAQTTSPADGKTPGPPGERPLAAGKSREYTNTAQKLLALGDGVKMFRSLKGKYPASLEDLRLAGSKDSWGTTLDMREGGFLISAGADKQWDTKDDIYFDPETGLIAGFTKFVDLPPEVLAAPDEPAASDATKTDQPAGAAKAKTAPKSAPAPAAKKKKPAK